MFNEKNEIIPEEPPDFIINLENSKLGIEVVEIFQPPPGDGIYLQQQESIKENIVDNTRDHLRKEGLPPIDLSINFNRF